MADFRDTITGILEAYSPLTTLMTGGIFSATDLDRRGILLNTAPKNPDGITIAPFIVVRIGASTTLRPHYFGKLMTFAVYFYQDTKYDKIDTAKRLVKNLLHKRDLSASDNETFGHIEWVSDIGENVEEQLGQTPMSMSRYTLMSKDKEI